MSFSQFCKHQHARAGWVHTYSAWFTSRVQRAARTRRRPCPQPTQRLPNHACMRHHPTCACMHQGRDIVAVAAAPCARSMDGYGRPVPAQLQDNGAMAMVVVNRWGCIMHMLPLHACIHASQAQPQAALHLEGLGDLRAHSRCKHACRGCRTWTVARARAPQPHLGALTIGTGSCR